MRFEAKHQGVKRKCKAMGFRNVQETVPKLMNQSRINELEKLVLKQSTLQPNFKKNSYFFGQINLTKLIFRVISVSDQSVTLCNIQSKFDKKLLAYEILAENEINDVSVAKVEILSDGLITKFGEKQFIFFFDYFE